MSIEEDIVKLHIEANDEINESTNDIEKDINSSNAEIIGLIVLAIIGFTQRVNKTNDQKYDALHNKISKARTPSYINAMKTLETSVKSIMSNESKALSQVFDKKLVAQLKQFYKYSSFSGLDYDQWWSKLSSADVDRIVQSVRYGVQQGLTTNEIIAHVRKNFKTTINGARMLSTTVQNGLINASRLQMFMDADVKRIKYVAVMDSRTSSICRELNGTKWAINDPDKRIPPLHPSCRSLIVPVE